MGTPTRHLPGEVGAAPSLAGCPGQLDGRVGQESRAEPVAYSPTPLLTGLASASLRVKRKGRQSRWSALALCVI